LSRITTNAFLDDIRRRGRRPTVALPDDADRILIDAAADPDAVLSSTTLPADVQAALRALPEEFRAAVVLCDVVGLQYDEIADDLGIPIGTVRSRIHRGRAQLRTMLQSRPAGSEQP
jgi:RNA polymerase sigma-70 factor (ECF subfamily)